MFSSAPQASACDAFGASSRRKATLSLRWFVLSRIGDQHELRQHVPGPRASDACAIDVETCDQRRCRRRARWRDGQPALHKILIRRGSSKRCKAILPSTCSQWSRCASRRISPSIALTRSLARRPRPVPYIARGSDLDTGTRIREFSSFRQARCAWRPNRAAKATIELLHRHSRLQQAGASWRTQLAMSVRVRPSQDGHRKTP
ncbi:hypothetical protein BamIOP4010DRAFT_3359 [Burkholderia ambifaria IOP40-10]|uniref:Uncharacterized protein n=1 Tax=Burkholderia ambifaria IOP40-10 TaxID=396596 RepID=B1FH49_9BURK|nr:hypothetical protein BamIOP4010DRAFT_3359 [Burkholderia ambifaria IOP40-10]